MLPAIVGAKAGQTKKAAGRQRLALILFGGIFVLLFGGFAIAQGLTAPSVAPGDVAHVSNVPDESANVSEAELKLAVLQQVAAAKLKKTPKPGSKKAEELKEAALGELLQIVWVQGEAEELGISVTDKQIEAELAQIKKTNFPTPAAFKEFLETSKLTSAEVNEKVEGQLLIRKIQEQITAEAPEPSSSAIAENYEENKATQFTTKPSRDARLVINENKAEVDAALAKLEADNSPASWKEVASKYSSDPSTKTKGGLQTGITEELLATAGPLKKAIFDAATGEVLGPIKFRENYVVFEVVKLNPEKVQSLNEVKAQISASLGEQVKQEFFQEFASGFQSKWASRTLCAADFLTTNCSNYRGTGHPAEAPAACYEANPKVPAKKGESLECPAPVTANKPALPGSVTVLKPTGERLAQRPRPEGLEETGSEAGAALPEGVTPASSASGE